MNNFQIYIQRVLKQIHPTLRISKESLDLINFVVNSLALRFAFESVQLNEPIDYTNKKSKKHISKTISSRDIQTVVRLLLTSLLAKHAVSEGTKAVTKFTSHLGKKETKTSSSEKAGLVFSVARVGQILKATGKRVSATAPVYLAAVLEYLVAEIVELSGNATRDNQRLTIQPAFIKLAVANDEELLSLMKKIDIKLPGFRTIFPNEYKSQLV